MPDWGLQQWDIKDFPNVSNSLVIALHSSHNELQNFVMCLELSIDSVTKNGYFFISLGKHGQPSCVDL